MGGHAGSPCVGGMALSWVGWMQCGSATLCSSSKILHACLLDTDESNFRIFMLHSLLVSFNPSMSGPGALCRVPALSVGCRRSVSGPGAVCVGRSVSGPGTALCLTSKGVQHGMCVYVGPRCFVSGLGTPCRDPALYVGPGAPALCVGSWCCIVLNLKRRAALHSNTVFELSRSIVSFEIIFC